MTARLFSILFMFFVGFGLWFQSAYMASYSREFEAHSTIGTVPRELLLLKPFVSVNRRDVYMTSRVSANEGRYFTNGRIVLAGNVKYEDFNTDGSLRLRLFSQRALGQVYQAEEKKSFFDSQRRLESVTIPGEVEINLGGNDIVKTRKVSLDFEKGVLVTTEPVSLIGPGKHVTGKGFEYILDSQDFTLGGRVHGEINPKLVR